MSQLPQIEGYHLDCILGQGGQGAVFGGQRVSDGRKVAIKVLHDEFFDQQIKAMERFHREIAVSKKFAHANVIRILDGGLLPTGLPFLVMDYLEGESLLARALDNWLTSEEILPIFSELAEALDYIHSQGLVHRDIKPANVWCCMDGRTVLLDFGLCFVNDITRLTRTGNIVGTIITMAPEQIHSEAIGPYTDIYSLGATMYCAATGKPPYLPDQLVLIGTDELYRLVKPPNQLMPSFSPRLSRVIMKCLHNCPEMRYQSAEELKEALAKVNSPEEFFDESSGKKTVEIVRPRVVKPTGRDHRPLVLVVLLLCLLLAGALSHGTSERKTRVVREGISLGPAYKKLVSKTNWRDEELRAFGKKVIAADRADKFNIHGEADDPFVVGCYSVILHVSRMIDKNRPMIIRRVESDFPIPEANGEKFPATSLLLRLFDHLGKKVIYAPNDDFLRLFVIENHLAQKDGEAVRRLKRLLDDITSDDERLICEFRLAEALHLAVLNENKWFNAKEAPQDLQQALWLISPAIELFYEGRFKNIRTCVAEDELLAKYVDILLHMRTVESKKAVRKLLNNVTKSGISKNIQAHILHAAAKLITYPVRGETNISKKEIDEGMNYACRALTLLSSEQKAFMKLDLLTRARKGGFYEEFKARVGGVKAEDFPLKERYQYYLSEAAFARENHDFNKAMLNLRAAKDVAPLREKPIIEDRITVYRAEVAVMLTPKRRKNPKGK